MTTLDDFFRTPVAPPLHPRLRDWKQRLLQPDVKAVVEVSRPGNAVGLAETEMQLRFSENGTQHPGEFLAWDEDLNAGLIQLHVRASSADGEAERFALGLRAGLRKVEREFGDGYLNSVLVTLLNESDLSSDPRIADVLKSIHPLPPNREGKAATRYDTCREMITQAISARAHELRDDLAYPEAEAKAILVDAVARYLDERFSVSRRRQLGLLP